MVAKSGCPVRGQMQVNSGHSIAISKSRPGRGLGKVSSCLFGVVVMPKIILTQPRILFQFLQGLEEMLAKTGGYTITTRLYFAFILLSQFLIGNDSPPF